MKLDADTWKWAIGIIFGAGMAYSQLKTVPNLADKVQGHEVRLSVMESNITDIKSGVNRILENQERYRGR